MRLWSISPEYLDAKGLVGVWREALLARKVLQGKTKGYRHHPQLVRFRNHLDPLNAINSFLYYVFLEGINRGYHFDKNKVECHKPSKSIISVTSGQVEYEFNHLLQKLKKRDIARYLQLSAKKDREIRTNPIFFVVDGNVETWEILKSVQKF